MKIIERVNNLEDFLQQNPTASFIPHMPVYKLDKATTKCRMVFLSNLCQGNPRKPTISHNQAMMTGPNLNNKLSTAILKMRFDKLMLCFDTERRRSIKASFSMVPRRLQR